MKKDKIRIITVYLDIYMYSCFFTFNQNINSCCLHGIDNRKENLSLPIHYNKIIEKFKNEDCWLYFVHDDFMIYSGIWDINKLDPGKVYGSFGVKLENGVPVAYGKHVCSNKDGSDSVEVGKAVKRVVAVDTLDCQSILIHTSLCRSSPELVFDENLTFDLYVEDFCMNAKVRHGIGVEVFPLDFQHYSHGAITERYHRGLKYLAEKYPDVAVTGSCSFIGGKAQHLEEKFQYEIKANAGL